MQAFYLIMVANAVEIPDPSVPLLQDEFGFLLSSSKAPKHISKLEKAPQGGSRVPQTKERDEGNQNG